MLESTFVASQVNFHRSAHRYRLSAHRHCLSVHRLSSIGASRISRPMGPPYMCVHMLVMWRTRSRLKAYCVCSPTGWKSRWLGQVTLSRGLTIRHKPQTWDRMQHGSNYIATSFAKDWPSKPSLAVVCTATCLAYPLNQQLLQYIFGYFSIFVHTHDGYFLG